MSTTTSKRTIIDLPEETSRNLSIMAAAEGKNLKSFIESLLISMAKGLNSDNIYKGLLRSDSEGNMEISEKERKEFEKWF